MLQQREFNQRNVGNILFVNLDAQLLQMQELFFT